MTTPQTPAPDAKFNTLAIVGFVLSFFIAIAGLVVSIIALRQLKTTGERGRGLAIAGIIISIVGLISTILSFALLPGILADLQQISTY